MWYENGDTLGSRQERKRGSLRDSPILRVNARLKEQQQARMRRTAAMLMAPVLVVGLLYSLWQGLRIAADALFLANPRYAIRRLEFRGGGQVVADFIRGKQNIREGMNIFAFSPRGTVSDFMQGAPNFKSMQVSRILPDTVRVEVAERVAVARLGRQSAYVIDEDGWIFGGVRTGTQGLPTIIGVENNAMRMGQRLTGTVQAAIDFVQAADDARYNLQVDTIDVSKGTFLGITLRHNGLRKEIDFSWKGIGAGRTPDVRASLHRELTRLVLALESEQGKKMSRMDATYSDIASIYGK